MKLTHSPGLILVGGLAMLLAACDPTPAPVPTVAPTLAPAATVPAQPTAAAQASPPAAPAASPLPAASPTPAAPATQIDAREAVTRSLTQLSTASSFRFEGSVLEGGQAQQVSGAFVPPDAMSLSTSQGELRVLPNAMYVQEPGGQWIGIRMGPEQTGGAMQVPFDPAEIANELSSAQDFQREGTETLDGVPATVYSYTEQESGQQLTTRVWVSNADGLPLKMETRQGQEVQASFRFTDFGTVPPITAPEGAQVLDLSDLEKALPGGMPTPGTP